MFYLVNALRERGHRVTVACQPDGRLAERLLEARHDVRKIPMRGEGDLGAVWRLRRLMTREAFDLVHSHTSHAHTLTGLAAPQGLPRIVHRRVDFSIYRHSFLGLNRWKYIHLADRFVTTSGFIKQVMVRDGIPARGIEVVHSATDPRRFEAVDPAGLREELGIPPDAPMVLNVGHLTDHKGQRYLVEAVPRLLQQVPRAYVVIVGGGELEADLKARAQATGRAGRVLFAGFRWDIPRFLAAADVFCLSSHMEGIGGSILEAMAAGRPAVATRAGGIPEVVEDGRNGLLCPVRDPAALADACARLLLEPGLAKRLAEEGRRTVREGYTPERLAEQTLAVYRKVLAG